MPAPIIAEIHLIQRTQSLRMEASVVAEQPHPLRWSLRVESISPGGVSQIAQSGATLGVDDRPVDVISLNANAAGKAVLTVADQTGPVSRIICTFGHSSGEFKIAPCRP